MTRPILVPQRRWTLAWILVAACALFAFLGRAPIATSHERRVAETAATMANSGPPWSAESLMVTRAQATEPISVNPWLIPIFEDRIRLQKPPVPYWVTAMLFRIFGQSPAVARLAPAAAAVIATGLLCLLVELVCSRRAVFFAGAIWVSSWFVLSEYRKSMADPYLAFTVLGAVWAWVRASTAPAAPDRSRKAALFGFYAFVALGLLAKGPVVLLHLAVALGTFTVCMRRRPGLPVPFHLLGLLIVLLITLPWPLYILLHVPGAVELWRYESVGTFADNVRNARPAYYYLGSLFLISLPWTLTWSYGLIAALKKRTPRRLFPVLWLLLTVVILSFSNAKKSAYLLPLMPAVVITTAQGTALVAAAMRRRAPAVLRIGSYAHTAAGVILAATIATWYFVQTGADRPADRGAMLALALVTILATLVPLFISPRRDYRRWFLSQAIVFTIIIVAYLTLVAAERAKDRVERSSPADATATEVAPAPLASHAFAV